MTQHEARAFEVESSRMQADVRVVQGARALVFLPGWACSRSDWLPVAESLPEYTSLALDLPGQGESSSDRAGWSIHQFAEAVAAVLTQLAWQDVVLVGHSLGGAVAVETSVVLPSAIRQVICLDALTYQSFYPRQDVSVTDAALAPYEDDFDGAVAALVRSLFVDATNEKLIQDITATMTSAPQPQANAALRSLFLWDRDEVLGRSTAPVSVVASANFLTDEAVSALTDRVAITPVDLGGHFFLREDPQATALAIRDCLRRS